MAMLGDLLSSFWKRRVGLAPSWQAIGLDQIPEIFASPVGVLVFPASDHCRGHRHVWTSKPTGAFMGECA